MKKAATPAEKYHISVVKTMPCIICHPEWFDEQIAAGGIYHAGNFMISEYHHIINGYRIGHPYGLPLCTEHHRGKTGFSGIDRGAWDKSLNNQLYLMDKVYQVLHKETPVHQSKIVPRRFQ